MSFWSRFSGNKPKNEQKRLDYLSEGLALERQGDFEAALTSYQLALRDQPTNHRVLQNMAIAYSKLGQLDEAGGRIRVELLREYPVRHRRQRDEQGAEHRGVEHREPRAQGKGHEGAVSLSM